MEGELTGMEAVSKAITDAIAGVSGQATPIIAAALGIGVVFWGAKLLWTKFKGMAK